MTTPTEASADVPEEEVLTAPEVDAWLRMPKRWTERQTQARRMPGAFRTGRFWRYDRREIEKRRLTGQILLPKRAR